MILSGLAQGNATIGLNIKEIHVAVFTSLSKENPIQELKETYIEDVAAKSNMGMCGKMSE